MADADKVMIDLRARLEERDRMMGSLRSQLDESLIERDGLIRENEEAALRVSEMQDQVNQMQAFIDETNQ